MFHHFLMSVSSFKEGSVQVTLTPQRVKDKIGTLESCHATATLAPESAFDPSLVELQFSRFIAEILKKIFKSLLYGKFTAKIHFKLINILLLNKVLLRNLNQNPKALDRH